MPIPSLIKRAFWPLVGVSAAYIGCILFLLHPRVQLHALYMHKFQLTWGYDLTKPEHFGFAKNQVAPFFIPTPDGEKLFAWHVLPLGLYAENRDALLDHDSGLVQDITQSASFRLLKEDPEARLIIHFHGNAGTVGASSRPIYTRSFSAASPYKLHVLIIDYRGFGYSTGSPSEDGLITDGLAAVKWATDVAGISPDRIALVGHSLGSAVLFGVAEALVNPPNAVETDPSRVELGALISIAGFSNVKDLLPKHHIAGFIPVLAPLRPYPRLQKLILGFVVETWESSRRVATLVRKSSSKLQLFILHAHNDMEIPAEYSDYLFHAAANATIGEDRELSFLDVRSQIATLNLGAEGHVNIWPGEKCGGKLIQQWVTNSGGHNDVVESSSVSLLIARALGLGKEPICSAPFPAM